MKVVLMGIVVLLAGLARGDADALYRQGAACFETDPAKACELFVQAAEGGNVSAMAGAGHCFETGTGTAIDYARAIGWYEKAVAQNSLNACEGLARIYASCPDPAFHDGAKAVKFAGAVARKKPRDAEALALLAAAHARNLDFDQAQQAQRAAVKFCSAKDLQQTKEQLGKYENGEPVPATASAAWLRTASNQGSIWAMFQLSEMMSNDGKPEEAFAFCHEAMLKGSVKAALLVGDFYWAGRGTQMDRVQAMQCYETAHKKGEQLDGERAERLETYTGICEKLKNSPADHCLNVGKLLETMVGAAGKKAEKPWTEEEKRGFKEKFLTQALYMYTIAEQKGSSAAAADIRRISAELQKLAAK